MSTQILNRSSCTITLSGEEREGLLSLLRNELGETRVEAHHTDSRGFLSLETDRLALIRGLIDKLETSEPPGEPPVCPTTIEGAPPMIDELYIDADGRFQLASDAMVDFLDFLRDRNIHVQVEATKSFISAGRSYGYCRLHHMYDADSVSEICRTWEKARGRGVDGAPT